MNVFPGFNQFTALDDTTSSEICISGDQIDAFNAASTEDEK